MAEHIPAHIFTGCCRERDALRLRSAMLELALRRAGLQFAAGAETWRMVGDEQEAARCEAWAVECKCVAEGVPPRRHDLQAQLDAAREQVHELGNCLADSKTRNLALVAQLNVLEGDTARIEWLAAQPRVRFQTADGNWYPVARGENLRQAIDQLMSVLREEPGNG